MITLWVVAAVMVLAALALVLRPLLTAPALPTVGQQDANVEIFRRRLAELDAERDAGLLSENDAADARTELERQLLGDIDPKPTVTVRSGRPAYVTAAIVAVALPLAAVLLYLQFGSPNVFMQAVDSGVPQAEQDQLAFIEKHLAELESKVQEEPDNLEAVLMLGRAYLILQRYDDAVTLYAGAESRFSDQPALLVDHAEALAYAQGGNLLGQPDTLIDRALGLEPGFAKGLWLAGLVAVQQDRPDEARAHWQKLLAVLPPESGTAVRVRELLAQVGSAPAAAPSQEAPPAAGNVALQVQVTLSPELADRVPEGATVFVLARAASGPRAPLAVVRQPVGSLPLAVTLDDSMAMVEGMNISRFSQVVVEARVSASGNAIRQPGDLIGTSQPIEVQDGAKLQIEIDEVVQ